MPWKPLLAYLEHRKNNKNNTNNKRHKKNWKYQDKNIFRLPFLAIRTAAALWTVAPKPRSYLLVFFFFILLLLLLSLRRLQFWSNSKKEQQEGRSLPGSCRAGASLLAFWIRLQALRAALFRFRFRPTTMKQFYISPRRSITFYRQLYLGLPAPKISGQIVVQNGFWFGLGSEFRFGSHFSGYTVSGKKGSEKIIWTS